MTTKLAKLGAEMPQKPSIAILIVAALPFVFAAPVVAQNETSPPPHHARGRIIIHPGRLLYRRCVDWYELQDRPSGRVLYPRMRCGWVRG
jgi:hypothetical protein